MKKFNLTIFILLIISFILTLLCGIFGTSISLLSSKEIKKGRELNQNLINEFKINNIDTVYDKNSNTFYYNVPVDYENNNLILKLELDAGYRYKIINNNLNIIKVNYDIPIDIIIYNDKYYFEGKIQLTNIPLVKIQTKYSINSDDINTIFNYINYSDTKKSFISNAKIHIRGSSSKYLDKKSYKIEMYNDKYTDKNNINISNFYIGSDFILDALYKDPSKIRNLLATELWNDISNDFTKVNIYSEFVELFINNEYKGLYLLTEPINRIKLNLNKSSYNDTSIIIKSNEKIQIYDNIDLNQASGKIFLEQELKYPNDETLYERVWQRFLSIINIYYYDDEVLYEDVINTFDLNNYIDIIIFNAFINNVDNRLERNNYFYMSSLLDNKIYIQPWDMEFSMGLLFSEKEERFALKKIDDYDQIYTQFYHENANEINKLLIKRYKELRKDILTKEYFDNKLDKYLNELNNGAAKRDSDKWYEYDVEKEIEDIRAWIYNRLDYMDEYIEGLENE